MRMSVSSLYCIGLAPLEARVGLPLLDNAAFLNPRFLNFQLCVSKALGIHLVLLSVVM